MRSAVWLTVTVAALDGSPALALKTYDRILRVAEARQRLLGLDRVRPVGGPGDVATGAAPLAALPPPGASRALDDPGAARLLAWHPSNEERRPSEMATRPGNPTTTEAQVVTAPDTTQLKV